MKSSDSTLKERQEAVRRYLDEYGNHSPESGTLMDLFKYAANTGQGDDLMQGILDSLNQGKDLLAGDGWENYVTPPQQRSVRQSSP